MKCTLSIYSVLFRLLSFLCPSTLEKISGLRDVSVVKSTVSKLEDLSTMPRPYIVGVTHSNYLSSDLQMGAKAHVPTHM